MTKKVNTDLIAGLTGLALTALFWFAGGHAASLARVRELGLPGLGTRFPTAIMLLMVTFSLALLVKACVRPELSAPFADERLDRIGVVALLLLAWVLGMRTFGFIVSSALCFSLITLYMARIGGVVTPRNLAGWALLIALEITVLYLIFTRVLLVPLPEGMFI